MNNKRHLLIEVLKGVAFAIAILGFFSKLIMGEFPLKNGACIIIIIVITVFYVLITIWDEANQRQIHRLEKNSPAEAAFFLKWYSQDGRLSIFCVDLLWLKDSPKIQDVLSLKRDNLFLYLRSCDDYIVNMLSRSGAHIYKVKDKIISSHRFSILDDEGIKSIIIRNKENEDPNKIEVQEFRNHEAFYNLAVDMLDDCYDDEYHVTSNSLNNACTIHMGMGNNGHNEDLSELSA